MTKTERLDNEPIKKLLFSLAIPSIISLLMNALNVAIDRMFVGNFVGSDGISAVTVSYGVYLLMQGISQLVSIGAAAAIAIRLGKNDKTGAEKIVGNTVTLSLILSVLIALLGMLFINPLLTIYGANAAIMPLAKQYLSVLLLGSFLFVFAQTLNCVIRGMGFAKRAMINFLLDIFSNIVMDALFVAVFKMGVFGAALATMLSSGVCAVLALIFLAVGKNEIHLKKENLVLDGKTVKNMTSIGSASALVQLTLSLITLITNQFAVHIGGSKCVAAYGVISTLLTLVYMPAIGLSQGMQPIVGYNLGAQKYNRVKETLKIGLFAGVIFAFAATVIFELGADSITLCFGANSDLEFRMLTARGLRICVSTLPIFTAILISANYFQSVKKPALSNAITLIRQIVLVVPLIAVLSYFFKTDGIFFASVISDVVVGAVTAVFLIKEVRSLSKTPAIA